MPLRDLSNGRLAFVGSTWWASAPWLLNAAKMPKDALNVTQPKFLGQVDKELASTPVADWQVYLQWHVLNAAADSLSQAFVDENFEFNGKFLSGAKTIKPRAIRCQLRHGGVGAA